MIRPEFTTVGLVPDEIYESQQETNIAAGFRPIQKATPHDTPLAIVGGGPSIKKHIHDLVNWPGHLWGINQSAQWLLEFNPSAPVWLFTCDPDPRIAVFADGVERAILGACCHPDLFEKFRGKDVRYFLTRPPKGVKDSITPLPAELKPKAELFGPSSVTRTFLPAIMLGYKDVTFFGCEGSIDEDTLEANACRSDYEMGWRSRDCLRLMIVKAGGVEYLTTPDYYITTTYLVNAMRAYPKLKEKSGGLLRGMLQNPDDWGVVAVSEQMRNECFPEAGEKYETKFDVSAERFA